MSRYSANVRIGNWCNELILAEEKAKQNLKTGPEMELSKVRELFLFMLKEIPPSFPVLGLSYGAVIQIVSPEMPPRLRFNVKEKQGLALGADINFRNVLKRRHFDNGDPVIGTGLMTPCTRNVWTLVPVDKSKEGKEVRFGDSFQLQIYNSDPPLYVEAPVASPSAPVGESGHVIPTLTAFKSTNSRFKVLNIYPQKRFETEGAVVNASEPVAIVQAASGASLAVEPETWLPSYFGMECEVSLYTFVDNKDKNKSDPRNIWSFCLSS